MSKRPYRKIVLFLLWLMAVPVTALAAGAPADEAFRLTVARSADQGLTLNWTIAPGHYLYRDQFAFKTGSADTPVEISRGETKNDPNFGPVEIYRGHVEAHIKGRDLPATGELTARYQGCVDQGVCLPPVVRTVDLKTLTIAGERGPAATVAAAPAFWSASPNLQKTPVEAKKNEGGVFSSLFAGRFAPMLISFLGFGFMLALTPCVFPMIPILSGVLAGSGRALSPRRGLLLSSAYVAAMASAYATLGVAAAWTGQNLQIALQTPVAIGLMSIVFIVLAFSMFGFYELQLPSAWTQRIAGATAGRSGSLSGAALIGFGSALIVGPCVTPPLAAALLYVARTGDILRGASALFSFGLGMGLPMIAFGVFGARLLPKSGPWLEKVKQIFGFVFIGLAIWMLGRVIMASVTTILWGGLVIAFGLWLGAHGLVHRIRRNFRLAGELAGAMAVLAGLATVAIGAVGGAVPNFARLTDAIAAAPDAGFVRTVATPAAFDAALSAARASGLPILVDFTAQWCAACKAIERNVLSDPTIRARLRGVAVIKADMTLYSSESQALMRRFDVAGPPTLMFLTPGGHEIHGLRSIGEISTADFIHLLDRAGA